MGKQHLDLFAFPARLIIGRGIVKRPGDIPGVFVNAAWHFSDWRSWAALHFQIIGVAVDLAGPVFVKTVLGLRLIKHRDMRRDLRQPGLRSCSAGSIEGQPIEL